MSPLTYWHYLLLSVIAVLFVLETILALRSDSKWSIFISITLTLIVVTIFIWELINQAVYHVEISHIDNKRLYQTEQVMLKGVVRNTGEFPVSNVIGVVKLINTAPGKNKKRQQFGQPTAFAELYKGDNPAFKPQNVTSEHIIADHLDPGSSKSFIIIVDYPPYFHNASYEVDPKVY